MKKLLMLTAAMLMATSAFAAERFLGSVTVQNFDYRSGVRINSCEGPRDQRIRSLRLLVYKDGVNLRRVAVRMEDRAGRPGNFVYLNVRPGTYRQGSALRLDLPGDARCVQAIQIYGDSVGGWIPRGGHRTPSVIRVYGNVELH